MHKNEAMGHYAPRKPPQGKLQRNETFVAHALSRATRDSTTDVKDRPGGLEESTVYLSPSASADAVGAPGLDLRRTDTLSQALTIPCLIVF